MKLSSTRDYSTGAIKMLVYGPAGVGKTTLAGTTGEPTLIISAESGLLSLAGKSIDVIDLAVDDNGQVIPMPKRIERLKLVYEYLKTPEAQKKWKWVFIDSLTEISQLMVERLRTVFPDRKDSLVLFGENLRHMQELIKNFRDLPGYNVVFSALEAQDKDENNIRYTGVMLTGKIADQVPGFFDELFYMHTDKEQNRMLRTRGTDKIRAKDRSGTLPELILVPDGDMTLFKIAERIKKGKTPNA